MVNIALKINRAIHQIGVPGYNIKAQACSRYIACIMCTEKRFK